MNATEFLSWEQATRDTIDLKKIYIDVSGDIVTGVLLSQIIFWNLPNKEGITKLRVKYNDELWLAKGREDWWAECRLSPKQFDRSIKILEEKKIVKTALKKFNGSPVKHIKLNLDILVSILQELLTKQEGKVDFDQKVKSKLIKGKNQTLPKGKMEINQTGKSLTETTPENTSEITTDIEEEVLKAYKEIKGRYLNTRERKILKELLQSYSKDLILKAIDIMVTDAEKITLKYITSTLDDWKTKGIQTVEEVDKMRAEWQESKNKKQVKKPAVKSKKVSTFNDYKQREYDFKDLESKLVDTGEEVLKEADCSKCILWRNGKCFLNKSLVSGKCSNYSEKKVC